MKLDSRKKGKNIKHAMEITISNALKFSTTQIIYSESNSNDSSLTSNLHEELTALLAAFEG